MVSVSISLVRLIQWGGNFFGFAALSILFSLRYRVYCLFRFQSKKVCVQPRPLAINVALPTFAADHHTAAPCYRTPGACDQSCVEDAVLLQCGRQTNNMATQLYNWPA